MRLVVSVKYLVGFVTAGSVAFLLSGSAWAAESSTNSVDSGSLVSVETQGNVVVSQEISKVSVVDGAVTGAGSNTLPESPSVSESTPVSLATGSSETTITSQQTTVSAAGANAETSAMASPSADTEPALSGTAAALPEPIAPAVEADSSGRTVLVNEQTLPVQPVIMSQATAVADLASHVPSAPASTHTPLPVKTTGVLFALTDHLASTIVPGLTTLVEHNALAIRLTLLSVIVVMFVVLLGGFAAQLKQSGFVTAARSDVADSHLNFATPLGMGYVLLRLRTHSPFLMVSDTKSLEGNRS